MARIVIDGSTVTQHHYRVDDEYVYPASAIKPFVAIAALRALDRLRHDHDAPVDVHTPLRLCRLGWTDCIIDRDATNLRDRTITVGHEIRKMLLVSSNVAFNRLFDFVGHELLNTDVRGLGFPSLRLRHRIRRANNLVASTIGSDD